MTGRATRAGAVVLAAGISATAPTAFAHALLDHAVPAVGSTVTSSPATLELDFSEDVEAAFSSVEVWNAATHEKVETRPLEHPQSDRLVVPLSGLPAGTYEIHWKVVSVDTHPTEGSFKFHVSPR